MHIGLRPLALATCCFLGSLAAHAKARPKDLFDGLKCGDDFVSALRGKSSDFGPGVTVAAIEAAHRPIDLKMLGADGQPGDPHGFAFWRICGKEYVLLNDLRSPKTENTVRDVLLLDLSSDEHHTLPGTCTQGGKPVEVILAVVKTPSGGASTSPAMRAWNVDSDRYRFVELDAKGMVCPAS